MKDLDLKIQNWSKEYSVKNKIQIIYSSCYTPSEGELYIVDVGSSNPSIYIGDGSTAGGKLASAREFNSFSKITISKAGP